jgi:hypothetical protein
MSQKTVLVAFGREDDLLRAVQDIDERGWEIVDVYTPYAVHGLEEALHWPRSRLPVACFLCGATGVALATWFQFWSSATDWPLNVGGRPWNSLPAFVPVIFETMVLFAGLGVVFAWLCRSRLYPGKSAWAPLAGLKDGRFAMLVREPNSGPVAQEIRELLSECGAIEVEERDEEGRR